MYPTDKIDTPISPIENKSEEDLFFDAISPEEGEVVMEILSEVANGTSHNCVHSIDIRSQDDTNVTMTCTLVWKGVEYYINMDDGNWNGTVINDWVWEWGFFHSYPRLPISYTIMPLVFPNDKIDAHIMLDNWESMLSSRKLDYVVYNYSYDRFVEDDPFIQSFHHYNKVVNNEGYRIVTEPVADQFREELLEI